MTSRHIRVPREGMRWVCHGLSWALLQSPRFPERESWRPTCPACGVSGVSYRTHRLAFALNAGVTKQYP